jgi:hypothetical protein
MRKVGKSLQARGCRPWAEFAALQMRFVQLGKRPKVGAFLGCTWRSKRSCYNKKFTPQGRSSVVEQRPFKPKVVGSIPTAPTNLTD